MASFLPPTLRRFAVTTSALLGLAVSTAQAADTVKIGLVTALSGQSAKSGEAISRGIGLAIDGVKLRVRVVETAVVNDAAEGDSPADIVAQKSGVITAVTAKRGRAAVRAGDAVPAGDVLICGEIPLNCRLELEECNVVVIADKSGNALEAGQMTRSLVFLALEFLMGLALGGVSGALAANLPTGKGRMRRRAA